MLSLCGVDTRVLQIFLWAWHTRMIGVIKYSTRPRRRNLYLLIYDWRYDDAAVHYLSGSGRQHMLPSTLIHPRIRHSMARSVIVARHYDACHAVDV